MPWFIRLAQRLRPVEGWPVFILAWAGVLCLPAALIDGQWLAGMGPGLWLATLAFILAWRLGHVDRLHGALVAVGLALSGCLADLLWGVQVLKLGQLWLAGGEVAAHLAWWLDLRRLPALAPLFEHAPGQAPLQTPVLTWQAAFGQGSALAEYAQRTGWWLDGMLGSRQPVPDSLVVAGLVLAFCWLAAAWAGWQIARHGRPFAGLLPSLVFVIVQAYLVRRGLTWLLLMVGLWPVLLALATNRWLARRWDSEGADYSPELSLTAGLAAGAVAVLILVLTPALPYLTSRQASEAFWRLFEKPYRRVEQRVSQSFPAAPGAKSLVPAGGVAAGGLPRSHLLGGRPDLGRQVALRIAVRGARPNDLLYWRGQTFSVYDGHGWQTDATGTQRVSLEAGQPWLAESLAARHTVLSNVDVYAATLAVLYAPGEPVSVDRPYQAITRGVADLVQLQSPGGSSGYTILSTVPDQNASALAAAGTAYPPEIAAIYLQLPDNLPPAVTAYAAKLTAGAATPYAAAVALERALRQIPYSLDVPPPPPDRELVSWFLFDLKRGYCDYYASAMVVLARSAGIPARLAIGYATGSLDARAGRYEVTEMQAHSWPELYFPRIGWVPFEPTAGLPASVRLPGAVPPALLTAAPPPPLAAPELAELSARGQAYAAQARQRARLGLGLAALCGLLAAWTAGRLCRLRRVVTAPAAAQDFLRLAAWGRRLGRPADAAETPREYVRALGAAADAAATRAHLDRAGAVAAAARARIGAERLAGRIEAAAYGPDAQPAAASFADRARRSGDSRAGPWAALRRLWLARHLRI